MLYTSFLKKCFSWYDCKWQIDAQSFFYENHSRVIGYNNIAEFLIPGTYILFFIYVPADTFEKMSHSSTSLYNLRSKYFIKTHSQVSHGWLYQRPRWSIAYTNLEQSELQRNAVLSIKTTDIVKEFIILYILFKLNLGITIQNIWSMKPLSWYFFYRRSSSSSS